MPNITDLILPGAKAVRNNAEKLLKDVTPGIFARKPSVEGRVIDTNHAAFVYGHLALYPSRIMRLLGDEEAADSLKPPQAYYDLFSIGAACHDDPEGKIYPGMQEITALFLSFTDTMLEKLPGIPESAFYSANSEERSRERFPITGSFVTYLLHAHPGGHLGQISTWRRCMGLGPI